MELNADVVNQHRQLEMLSCIPMSVEFVLKQLGRVPIDYYDLQLEWRNRPDSSFVAFEGRNIKGVRFRHQYGMPRGDNFPLDDLFRSIESELADRRYVIISLESSRGWHMFVIYDRLQSGEFRAVSKVYGTIKPWPVENVQEIVRRMKGTDILTYEILDRDP